jgi:IS5 family transposase
MTKKAYRVRNWKQYNKSLVSRGSITLWIDEKNTLDWYESASFPKQPGRPNTYSELAIKTVLILKQAYRLTLRSAKGFVESIFKLMRLDLNVPCYTRICRRQATIALPSLPTQTEGIHLVVDASGLKIFGEGEWKVRQHGYDKRRTWRKLHIGVDESSKLVVAASLTKSNYADDKKLPDLLNQYKGQLHQVSADGAYDSHDCFDLINKKGAVATIPPQANSKHKLKTHQQIKRVRDKTVWEIQQHGREEWKRKSNYHRRSLVENAFYRYKQLFGDKLCSRKMENQQIEALLRCHMLNKLTLLGMPISVPVF